ncbi:hypothetical protein PpBr36_03869 [Pyricularia pennisetigena]|uniref:hypothetical protein n=1 Tax=Pyricularia pennisetigena TaxID=1578925 RepID=UPI00114F0BC5|nr:hypothetical protein PpBr36_03869 [Pyricularia pennisetigena]TLS30181.1 hypothetical protein PpBr36_03869 [Pyricularia pennisetigena]
MKKYIATEKLKQCPGCKFVYKREEGCRHMDIAELREINDALETITHAESPAVSPTALRRAVRVVEGLFPTSEESEESEESERSEKSEKSEESEKSEKSESSDDSDSDSSTRRLLFQDRVNTNNPQSQNGGLGPEETRVLYASILARTTRRRLPPDLRTPKEPETGQDGVMPKPTHNPAQDLMGTSTGRDAARGNPGYYRPHMEQAVTQDHLNSLGTAWNDLGTTYTFHHRAAQSGSSEPWYPNPFTDQRYRSMLGQYSEADNVGMFGGTLDSGVGGFGFQSRVQVQQQGQMLPHQVQPHQVEPHQVQPHQVLPHQVQFQTNSVYGGIAHPAFQSHPDLVGSSRGQRRTDEGSQYSRKRSARELSDYDSSPFAPDGRPSKTIRSQPSLDHSGDMDFEWDTDFARHPQQMVPTGMPGTHARVLGPEIRSTDWRSRHILENRQFALTALADTQQHLTGNTYMNHAHPWPEYFPAASLGQSATLVSSLPPLRPTPYTNQPWGPERRFQQQTPSQGFNNGFEFQAPSPGSQGMGEIAQGFGQMRLQSAPPQRNQENIPPWYQQRVVVAHPDPSTHAHPLPANFFGSPDISPWRSRRGGRGRSRGNGAAPNSHNRRDEPLG